MHGDSLRVQALFTGRGERDPVEERLRVRGRFAQALERGPFVTRPDIRRRAKGLHLRGRHQPGMVVLVACERQAKPF